MRNDDTEPGALSAAMGQPTHAQILAEIREMRRESREWRREVFGPMAKQVEVMQAELTRNTEVTTQVRDAAGAFAFGRKAVIWVGTFAAGAYGIWQLFAAIRKGTPDIGP